MSAWRGLSGGLGLLALACAVAALRLDRLGTVAAANEAAAAKEQEAWSDAVIKDGLQLEVRTQAGQIIEGAAPAFRVRLKNVSDKSLMLFDPDQLNCWTAHFGQWQPDPPLNNASREAIPEDSKELKAGATREFDLDFRGLTLRWTGDELKKVAPRDALPVGTYQATLTLHLATNSQPDFRWPAPHWTGDLTSKPVDLKVLPAKRGG